MEGLTSLQLLLSQRSFDNITYTYNANGIRTSKTVSGIKHTYTLDGTKILREEWDGNTLIPLYDNEDSVCGIIYNNTPYYFHKNLQGDIIAILNKDAEEVATYSYDAWGACTVKSDTSNCSIATINPFRYRGYYYDEEIDMYYLQSRYYDAEVGRFINEDDAEFAKISQKIITHNIYAYCCNDPVNGTDVVGRLAAQLIARIILGIMIGILIQLICDLLSYWYSKIFNNPKAFSPSAGDYVSSAISWALTCVTFNKKAIEICAALIPLVIKHVYRAFNKNFDWIDFFIDFLFVLISFLVNKGLDNKKRNNMKKILKKAGNGNKAWNKIRINTKKLNMKVNVWGIKANLGLNISGVFVSNLYSCLYAKYAK